MDVLFDTLLAAPTPAGPTFEAFWRATRADRARFEDPTQRAVALGFSSDRLGFAFLGGYASALTRVDATLGPDDLGALCATEEGGAHPRAINTSLAGGRLWGAKRFVSGGPFATRLLVVATTGTHGDGRPRLVVARVSPGAKGVRLEAMPELPFVPEVPHASVALEAVAVAPGDVLPGDGYTDVLKPFRTLEDLHVYAATLGYLWSVARRAGWPRPVAERLWAAISAALALGGASPSAPATHLALAGLLGTSAQLLDEVAPLWASAPEDEAARFARDRPLLLVAQKAREARRDKAWASLRT